jgi:hypothetical protein
MSAQTASISKGALWAGRIMSSLVVLLMVSSAVMKLMKPPSVVQGFGHFGFSEGLLLPLGILELVCTVIYVVPRTSVLGAILLTGYLGGATAATARIGEPFIAAVVGGILVWGGLFMRDRRLRELIPLCR